MRCPQGSVLSAGLGRADAAPVLPMAIPFPSPFDIVRQALPAVFAIVVLVAMVKFAPQVVRRLRQGAYDRGSGGKARRLESAIGRGRAGTPEAAVALIRGLHPQRRSSAGGWWPVGWPCSNSARSGAPASSPGRSRATGRCCTSPRRVRLAVSWNEFRDVTGQEQPAVWSAVGRLRMSSSRPLGDPGTAGRRFSLDLRCRCRRLPRTGRSASEPWSVRSTRLLGSASSTQKRSGRRSRGSSCRTSSTRSRASPALPVRPSRSRCPRSSARHRRTSGRGALASRSGWCSRWRAFRMGPRGRCSTKRSSARRRSGLAGRRSTGCFVAARPASPPRFALGDWELAQLWYLPDAAFEAARFPRE